MQISNLKKDFTRGKEMLTAVGSISFELYSGECLGLVGESGCGKSTTVNMITRLIEPTEGRIILRGKDITNMKGKQLREVYKELQMVFQMPAESFDPRRTLGDGIGESLQNAGYSRKDIAGRVRELLNVCGLDDEFAKRYPHEVSGGQCQRAAIARAIAIAPNILICDEATSSLDVTVQKQIIELLRSLQKENSMSYLFISHDLALVQEFCDRVLVMYKGEIVEEGTPDDVIMSPKHEHTKMLVDSAL